MGRKFVLILCHISEKTQESQIFRTKDLVKTQMNVKGIIICEKKSPLSKATYYIILFIDHCFSDRSVEMEDSESQGLGM